MNSKLTFIILCCLLTLGLNAQTLWTGNVDSDWNNPGNWTAGVPESGITATVPGNPVGGNDPIYEGDAVINFTIQISGTLTFNTLIYNTGTLINFSAGTIISNDKFINSGVMVFDNDGTFENNGIFDNFGTFDNAASATLINNADAVFNNFGTFRSNGAIDNSGIFNTSGQFRTTTAFTNSGILNINGNFQIPFGSALTNNSNASITIGANGTIDINAPFTNSGTILNDGAILISTASVLTNESSITNNGRLETAGLIENNSTINNNGTIVINDVGRIENNTTLDNNGLIELSICGILVQNAGGVISGTIESDGLIYEINGTVDATLSDLGRKFNDLAEKKIPVAGCKPGVFKILDQNGTASLVITDVDKGSYGECGAAVVSRSLSRTDFTTADIGDQVVTLRIEDEFGFVSTCDAIVSILPFQEPIEPTEDPDITFTCPDDITVTGLPGAGSAEANWTEPEATTTCTIGGTLDCGELTNSLTGFTYLGELNNSRYFVSNQNRSWYAGRNIAASVGGHLAAINSAEENEFIRSNLASGSVWIGFNDIATEGHFVWSNKDQVNYTNWESGEPNGGASSNFTRLKSDNGRWTDRGTDVVYPFVVELPCPSNVSCNDLGQVNGYTFIGELGGSKFYRSNTARNFYSASRECIANGGRLAVIDNAAKNDLIANNITTNVYIGLSDRNSEGSFIDSKGNSSTYFNWYPNEPNNFNDEDAVEIYPNGQWNDQDLGSTNEYILEIPCLSCATVENNIPEFTFLGEYGDSKYYQTNATNLTWTQAQTLAENSGGYLAVVGSADENEFIRANAGFSSVWIGLNDEASEGNFVWVNGDAVNYTNWRSGEPNNSGGNEDYTRLLQATGEWTDRAADFRLQGIMEIACNASAGNGDGNLTVKQVQGVPNGGEFLVGTNEVLYRVTDDCGNEEICGFEVTVIETPADFEITSCPEDITIAVQPGATTAVVEWDEPTASSNCFRSQIALVDQTVGEENGAEFEIGTQQILYAVFDSCGNFGSCSFNVTVTETPAILEVITCPGDIAINSPNIANGAIVTWDAPTATTDCFSNDLSITQIQGPSSGSVLQEGTTRIIYLISDGCNNTEVCIFDIVVGPCPAAGTLCDDNDPSTFDDQQDGACNCVGTPCPEEGTACDDNDPTTENDTADGLCGCEGTPCPEEGTACDDGNPSTIDDVEDGFCNCIGSACPDAGLPCDDNDPSTFDDVTDGECGCAGTSCPEQGTACDDNDPSTFDDIADGICGCEGTPCPTAGTTCDDGNSDTENDIQDGNCNCAGTPINTGCANTENLALNGEATQSSTQSGAEAERAIDGNTNGEFYVDFSITQTNWEYQPWLEIDLKSLKDIETIKVWNRTDCCMDFLSDYHILVSDVPFTSQVLSETQNQAGVADYNETNTADLPTTININRTGRYVRIQLSGTAFLSLAELEIIGCAAEGVEPTCTDGIQNGDETGIDCGGPDCPECCPLAGTACDDNDPNTENDVEDGNCNCAGTPISTGTCDATINLALDKTSRQSSTQNNADAELANDGETNGNFYEAFSINQTNWEYQAWWEVDLGAMFNVDQVNIYNREDCCTDFLSDYYVLIADQPFGDRSLTELLNDPSINSYRQTDPAARPTEVTANTTGRFVRVQLNGTSFLSMAEVEVLGCAIIGGEPTCFDGVQNGDETGIDCGGANCPECCPLAGTTCDDNDPNTENDVEDGNCNCAGTPILDGGEAPSGYCQSRGFQPWQQWISRVEFGTIDNSSVKEGYGDFTNLSTAIIKEESYELTVTPAFSFTYFDEYISVWIDYNRDGDFEDDGELVLQSISMASTPPFAPSPINAISEQILIPATAETGLTRMRISMQKNEYAMPCSRFDLGEVEDYLVNITATTVDQATARNVVKQSPSSLVRSFEIYPNPASELINVELGQYLGEQVSITITNTFGQVISTRNYEQLDTPIQQFSIGEYVPGVYSINIHSKDQKIQTKLFIVSDL